MFRLRPSCLIRLRAVKNDDVFVAIVTVKRDPANLAKPQQCGSRAMGSISVKPVDLDAILQWFPWNLILELGDVEKIVKLEPAVRLSAIGF